MALVHPLPKNIFSALLCLLFVSGADAAVRCASEPLRIKPLGIDGPQTLKPFSTAPAGFIENRGQAPSQVRYYARGERYTVYLGSGEATLRATDEQALALRFLGSRREAMPEGRRPAVTKVNFAYSNDPSRWQTAVPAYDEVIYRDLWPGIDLVFHRSADRLKYDFIVHSGADPSAIRLAWDGARGLSVDDNGNLLIRTASGTITDERPYTYQEIGGKQSAIETRFRLVGRTYGFVVGAYDRQLPLVIDPGLEFSTFLGGTRTDFAWAIALDPAGNIYVAGETGSADFPLTADAVDTSLGTGNPDAFVAKLDPTGSTLLYATFLGGGSSDAAWNIAVDRSGNVYVAGNTFPHAIPFPTTENAFDRTANGRDVFLTKLTPAGTLAYSTVFGANASESLFGISNGLAADEAGNVWIAGQTESLSTTNPLLRLPVTADAFDPTPNGGGADGFIARFNTNQSGAASLTYSSFFGGNGFENAAAIALGPGGNIYLLMTGTSSNLPVTAGAYDTTYNGAPFSGTRDFHISKLDPSRPGAAALLMGTYLGGRGSDFGSALALDSFGNIYVGGSSTSIDFPTTENAFDRIGFGDMFSSGFGSLSDAVLAKLSADGSQLLYSTYLGHCGSEGVRDLAVDHEGNAYLLGGTFSARFPTTFGAYDMTHNGSGDVYLAKLNTNSSGSGSLRYSTLLGGSNHDQVGAFVLDPEGKVYLAGTTASRDFPTTPGAFDTTQNHPTFPDTDAFVAKLDLTPAMQLEAIAEQLLVLAQEIMNTGQGQSLVVKLEAAREQLSRDNVKAAAAQIESFIHQVRALVAAEVLTVEEGQMLIQAAERILAQLSL